MAKKEDKAGEYVVAKSFWVGKKYYQKPKPASSLRGAISGIVTREKLGDEEFDARLASGDIEAITEENAGGGEEK